MDYRANGLALGLGVRYSQLVRRIIKHNPRMWSVGAQNIWNVSQWTETNQINTQH